MSLFICLWLAAGALNLVAQPVTLTDQGGSVVLANGIVSASIDKSNGRCTDLRFVDGPNLLANGGRLYFDANGSVNGGSSVYVNFSPDAYQVVTHTTDRVEVALTDTNLTGFEAAMHYVMRSGDSGLYVFTTWRHGAADPQAMLEQSRLVLRCDPGTFTRAYASSNKFGQMIEPILLQTNLPTIMDATYKLPLVSGYTNETGHTEDGYPVYTKYDWCEVMENHSIEGLTSETVGLWMLFGSVEYHNGGPTKANLILHGTDTTPLLLWDFHAQHFGSSRIELAAGEPWDKIMGPCFIYLNRGDSSFQLWQDALNRAADEQSSWPCPWMDHPLYPLQRGTVTGVLHVTGHSTRNALLVLAQPGAYWQDQSRGYQFWIRAAADGSFSIPKVRPGIYSLFARVPGLIGQFELPGVTVAANQTNDVGWLDWVPPRRERLLWRIGTPDLSAGEFRFGDRMRQFGLWWRYMEEQGTNDLVHRIGHSTPAEWYHGQSVVALDDGTFHSPVWKVEFVLEEIPPAPAVLTVDLAGSLSGTLLTTVNGTSLENITLTNDACIYRSATKWGRFRHLEFLFSPALLEVGTNLIAFSVSKPSPWTGTKPVQPSRGVMYDCIQLEAGAPLASVAPRFTAVEVRSDEVVLRGAGGVPGGAFELLTTSDLRTTPELWTMELDGHFDGAGHFVATYPLNPGSSIQFHRLVVR